MIEEEGQLFEPGRDHNQPPGLLPMEDAIASLRKMLAVDAQEGGKTFAERKGELLRSARAAVVRDRETAGAAADVVKIAARVWEKIDAARLDRSNPYRDIANALGRAAADWWHEVDEAMRELRRKIDAYTDEEDRRVEQQQAEQEAEMARLRAAAAPASPASPAPSPPASSPPPTPGRRRKITGDYGAVVSQAERTTYSVVDVRALPDSILNARSVHEAIIAVVRRTAKDFGVPAGVKAETTTENQIR